MLRRMSQSMGDLEEVVQSLGKRKAAVGFDKSSKVGSFDVFERNVRNTGFLL